MPPKIRSAVAISFVMGALAVCIEARLAAAANSGSPHIAPLPADAALRHPTRWPIRHWRNHQPRRSDIAPEQSEKIDRLYMQMERKNPDLIAPDFRPK